MLKQLVLTLTLAVLLAASSPAAAQHEAHEANVEAEHNGAAAHEGHAKPVLLPDPTSKETVMQALWVVIIFVVLLAILYPTAWKNVLAGLKAREQRIRQDIADAEAARAKAEATLRDYTAQLAAAEGKVREMIAKAGTEGERVAATIRTHAQQEAEEIKERTTREIEAARDQAKQEIHTYAADLATSVAAKILRRNLKAEDQRDLVNSSLEQLQTLNKN